MTPERWQRVKELFQEAKSLEEGDREALLREHCGDDPELLTEVASLLSADEALGGFLATGRMGPRAHPDGPPPALETLDTGLAGQRLGSYQILRRLARGGMGEVYLAARADDAYEKRVALKVIRTDVDLRVVLQRFHEERQILARLEHPNIARLLDAGTTPDGRPFFVMEYVDGEPLRAHCDARGLGVRARLELFLTVCGAVHYAHQNLVVHRDLKPGNIPVTPEGVPKLLDFGIAKLLREETSAADAPPTVTMMRLLTPDYASPEQVKGEAITTATDVYSLGVLLYELLTGQRPHGLRGRTAEQVLAAVCEEVPTAPSEAVRRETGPEPLRRQLTGDLDMIVLMALRKEASRRYASVEQLADDVRRHLSGLPVRARPDTFRYRAGKFVRRHRAGVAAAALVFVSLVAGIAGTAWQARVAGFERARAERRFQDVRQLANAFIFDVHDAIRDLPGATHAREVVVKKALEYLDRLAGEAAGDRSLQEELAVAYQRVGDVQGLPDAPNVGDYKGALASYERSLALREGVADQDQKARRAVSVVLNRIGRLRLFTGDRAGALASFRRSTRIAEELTSSTVPTARRDLMVSSLLLADALAETGDTAAAIDSYRRVVGLAEQLHGEKGDEGSRRDLSLAYDYMARSLRDAGRLEEALAMADKGLEIDRTLVASESDNIHVRRDLGVSLQQVGHLQTRLGRLPAAVATLTEAVAVGRSLLALDAADVDARHGVSVSEFHLAEALARQNDLDGALVHHRRGLAITDGLLSKETAATYRADRAESLWRMGAVLEAKGLRDAAVAATRSALELAEPLARETPDHPELHTKLAAMHMQMAQLEGDPCGRSRPWLEKGLAGVRSVQGRVSEVLLAENRLSADDLSGQLARCGP
jgi:serine/threonine protein kinase/tetratricopeptide (TPR) repeat protein